MVLFFVQDKILQLNNFSRNIPATLLQSRDVDALVATKYEHIESHIISLVEIFLQAGRRVTRLPALHINAVPLSADTFQV